MWRHQAIPIVAEVTEQSTTQSGLSIVSVQIGEGALVSCCRSSSAADRALAADLALGPRAVQGYIGRLHAIGIDIDRIARALPAAPTPPVAHYFHRQLLTKMYEIGEVITDARSHGRSLAGELASLRDGYQVRLGTGNDTPEEPVKTHPSPKVFTDSDLYGPDGAPHAADINQDAIGDCFMLSTLGAVANQTPDRIQRGIGYDPDTQSFTVTALFDGKNWSPIVVTQDDINDNIARLGASKLDNGGGPVWPAVMEAAYAKLLGSGDSARGYAVLNQGGASRSAMEVLTGRRGDILPAMMFKRGDSLADYAFGELERALASGRPVTMGTGFTPGDDGLSNHHSYTVESVGRDIDGTPMLVLRNPWGHNEVDGIDNGSPIITLPLSELTEHVALDEFTIGR